MNRKYVIIVHGLMIKNGTVAPYGTEVTEGIQVDDTEGKVAEGYLLSKADFDKKNGIETAAPKEEIADKKEDAVSEENADANAAVEESEQSEETENVEDKPKDKGVKKLI